MPQETVAIVSMYLGAQWAGKYLKDWGKNVVFGQVPSNTQVIILDSNEEEAYKHLNCEKIILKDVEMSPEHILAQSTVLVTFGQKKQLFFPNYIVQLVVSNGLSILVFQILLGKKQKSVSTKPNSHQISIVSLVKYFGAFNISAKQFGMITKPRGQNVLQGGAPYYSVYKCKEGYVAVGNLQPKFYDQMIRGLNLSQQQREFCEGGQHTEQNEKFRNILSRKFMEKTAKEWNSLFLNYDTCITEIKDPFTSNIRQPKLIDLKPRL